jgi:hypothetical protein
MAKQMSKVKQFSPDSNDYVMDAGGSAFSVRRSIMFEQQKNWVPNPLSRNSFILSVRLVWEAEELP